MGNRLGDRMVLFLPSVVEACWGAVFCERWPGLTRCWDMTLKETTKRVRLLCFRENRGKAGAYSQSRLAGAPALLLRWDWIQLSWDLAEAAHKVLWATEQMVCSVYALWEKASFAQVALVALLWGLGP